MQKANNSPNNEKNFEKLRRILTIIGESLKEYFKQSIEKETNITPNEISIIDVTSQDFHSSRSKTHFVTYNLETEIGKHVVYLIVKFSKDEEAYIKEISNYEILSSSLKSYPCVLVPPIIYKSAKNKCIIYEAGLGVDAKSNISEDDSLKFAARTLALIHGVGSKEIDIEPYKTVILFLISLLNNESLEQELINLLVPSLAILKISKGSAVIHGDFHKSNLKMVVDSSSDHSSLTTQNCEKVKVYVFNSEFIEANRDRCEDIGAYFALDVLTEYKNNKSFISTKNKIMKFIYEYDKTLNEIGVEQDLQSMYPDGYTIDFHVATYILYDIIDAIKNEKLLIDSSKIQTNLELLRALLRERPFA
ncbi:MAG: hypothetical protein ACTSXD_04180 [Candidatus Heimdallarchaeaceae archaeon]